MSPETLNIFIGASIALLASIITSFLTQRFQKANMIQQREFLLQDAYLQNKSQIIVSRADEIEKLIDEYIMWFSKLNTLLMSIQISDAELRASVGKLHEDFWRLPYGPHVIIIAKSLDNDLATAAENLLNKLLELNLKLLLYINTSEQHPTEIIEAELESIDQIFPLIIAGLDRIKIDSKNPSKI